MFLGSLQLSTPLPAGPSTRRASVRPWLGTTTGAQLRPGHRAVGLLDLRGGVDLGAFRLGVSLGARSPTGLPSDPAPRATWDFPAALLLGWAPDRRVAPRVSAGPGIVVRHFRQSGATVQTVVVPTVQAEAAVAVRVGEGLRVHVGVGSSYDLAEVIAVEPDGSERVWQRWTFGASAGIVWAWPPSVPTRIRRRSGDPGTEVGGP